jgi:signal transduction histidine kinase
MIAENGRIVWVETRMAVICGADGLPVGMRGITLDVTDRRWTETRRRLQFVVTQAFGDDIPIGESGRRVLQALCETLDWHFGELWCIDDAAGALVRVSSWHPPYMDFREFDEASRSRLLAPGVCLAGRVWKTKKPAWVRDVKTDPGFSRNDAATRAKLSSAFAYPVALAHGPLGVLVFFARDVHEASGPELMQTFAAVAFQLAQYIQRKHSEEERIQLQSEILQVSEAEQQRIGQDLHDDLCQHLAGIHLVTGVLARDLEAKSRPEAEDANRISNQIRDAIERARMLARGLSPVAVESGGLAAALQELAQNTSKLFSVTCDFRCAVPLAIGNPSAATHLFRIAQEAITNAVKHGHAKQIAMNVARDGEKYRLAIKDDGCGFSQANGRVEGMGLRTMRYRATIIGATLEVRSTPGRGTEVICMFGNETVDAKIS